MLIFLLVPVYSTVFAPFTDVTLYAMLPTETFWFILTTGAILGSGTMPGVTGAGFT